ncbi:methyl-accepting chemotaxis sensory transducer [Desulfarculus baarsii DSM 2075]|uniref:Methyl-accepting chemotaxis sensory transducer n=1 Tax=Desulfarculus baarsii (strain ATCC 33931 / DSM 2075 / LMG 7858 / VKM B-1802 / 2st14) TaxID=644282 RepID=E1QGT6_DESB2|nr:methyl-accepting chemotaxis protein [Desulfarculus baarsii]ADK84779.1 methyl-accepting chemotaxis sensory transducer [Desulfarculus baarsii DSM 2075]
MALRIGISGKILSGVLASLAPMALVILLLSYLAASDIQKSAQQDLEHITTNLRAICQSQEELLQKKVDSDLKVAVNVLNQFSWEAPMAISPDQTTKWTVTNQDTKQSQELELPLLQAGDHIISKNFEAVDRIKSLVGSEAAFFQRMNDQGDLLNVSTTVAMGDKRAIGTYMPASSPVAQALLANKEYRGRAFVVDGWYITAYKPMIDVNAKVVGGLYVGVPELSTKSLLDAFRKIKVYDSGFAFVFNRQGDMIVHPKLAGTNVLGQGEQKAMFGQMVQALDDKGAAGQVRSIKLDDADGRAMELCYATFQPWDWVIGVAVYEDEMMAGVRKMNLTAWLVLGLTVLVMAPFGLVLSRSLAKPLKRSISALTEGAQRMSQSAATLSSSSQSLAEGSSQQAAALEETSASLEEMSSMTKKTAVDANQADGSMGQARKMVDQAGQDMELMAGSMGQIADAGREIGKIIKTIDEIAFQTNILALNAAVEAARAGEAGAGFAVVAGEVRNLAMRSADAARNTQKLIDEVVGRINQGAELVGRSKDSFQAVAGASQKAAGLISEISVASGEQAQGIEQVSKALHQMDSVVQRNAAQAEEAASAAEEMEAQARTVQNVARDLQRLMHGAGEPVDQTPAGGAAPGKFGKLTQAVANGLKQLPAPK